MKKIAIIISFLALVLLESRAQGVFVEQKIDSIGIFIGQQAHVTVTVTAGENAQVVFPDWKPQTFLVPGVELLAIESDSAEADNSQKSRTRRLTITSFDENIYSLPPVEVKVDGKPYQGEQLALKVVTMDVDTLHPNEFFPPKDVQDNPFSWSEWSPLLWLSLLIVALLLLGLWLRKRLKANRKSRILQDNPVLFLLIHFTHACQIPAFCLRLDLRYRKSYHKKLIFRMKLTASAYAVNFVRLCE